MKVALYQVLRKETRLKRYIADENRYFPLWQGYLKSYVEKYGAADLAEIRIVQSLEELLSEQFDVVGLSSNSFYYSIAGRIAEDLKKKYNPVIVVGGPHISALPNTLKPEIDFGVIGEGEATFLELLQGIKAKARPEDFERIPGIVFHKNSGIFFTGHRDLITPLDLVPIPERAPEYPPTNIMTSRGCHYKCLFCSSANFWRKVRYFSPEHVLEELNYMYELWSASDNRPDTMPVSFLDDLAMADRKRFARIVQLVEDSHLNEKMNFSMYVRAEIVTPELCTQLRRMNVTSVRFGFESQNERILKILKGPSASPEKNQRALDICADFGFFVEGNFIVGYFDETEEEALETFAFSRRNMEDGKLSYSHVAMPIPIPGTPLWDEARQKNLVSEDMDWSRLGSASPDALTYGEEGIDLWLKLRREANAVYLPEKIPEERMCELLAGHWAFQARHNKEMPRLRFAPVVASFIESSNLQSSRSIAVYGAGVFSEALFEHLPNDIASRIIGVVDGYSGKQGTKFMGFTVGSPESLRQLKPDTIIIASNSYKNQITRKIEGIYDGSVLPRLIAMP